jgi:hypothetical protein
VCQVFEGEKVCQCLVYINFVHFLMSSFERHSGVWRLVVISRGLVRVRGFVIHTAPAAQGHGSYLLASTCMHAGWYEAGGKGRHRGFQFQFNSQPVAKTVQCVLFR